MAPAHLLLVGSIHLANPGLDAVNTVVDDVLALQRQDELREVVSGLGRFRPTKVAVERPFGDPRLHETYQAYVAGQRVPDRSETEQLAFPVARALGHRTLYGIDAELPFYDERMNELVAREPFAGQWQAMLADTRREASDLESFLGHNSLGQVLRRVNSPGARTEILTPYLHGMLPISDGDNTAGPDMVARWYQRNFRIAARLHSLAEDGDRILVIYGAGHIPVLEHTLSASPRFALVDPLDYLPP